MERNLRYAPRQGRGAAHRADNVLLDRLGYGTADQVHPADEPDPLFRLFVEFEHEAEDVACVDEANDDHVPRIGNRVGENGLADACPDELACGALFRIPLRKPVRGGQRPEVAGMVFQDLPAHQIVQRQIDDRLDPRGEPFDPVTGVPLNGFVGNFLQQRVQCGIAGLRSVQQDQRLHVRVDAGQEREFGKRGAGDGALQSPAGNLVEISGLVVEEHQNELVGQT